MKVVFFIMVGLLPAFVLRYVILRKPISHWATAATCFGILIFLAILVSTSLETTFQQPADGVVMGPLPILTTLVSQMVYAGLPAVAGSYWILRRGGTDADHGE